VGYAAGQTDTFQGTGVWNGVKLQREVASEETPGTIKADESAKSVSKVTTPQK
jgi:hypothetical protein